MSLLKKVKLFLKPKLVRKQTPKRVAVIGWLGAFNLGDEMMLNVTLGLLDTAGHQTTLLVHRDDEDVKKRYEGRTIYRRQPLSQESIDGIVENNDVLFVNGGAVIDDRAYESEYSLSKDIARLSSSFTAAGKKVIVHGVSTNKKLTNTELIADYKQLINTAAYFSVRDTYSKDELLSHFPEATIDVVDDIVFAEPLLGHRHESAYIKDSIGVIALFDDTTEATLKIFFDKLIKATGKSIRVINFYDENSNDARYIEKMKDSMGEYRFNIKEINEPQNATELYHALQDLDIIVSMRYHGTLFANAIGKKVVSLDFDTHPHYYNKNKYLQENYTLDNPVIPFSKLSDMTIDELWGYITAAKPAPIDSILVQERAEASLVKAMQYIN